MSKELEYIEAKIAEYGAILENYIVARNVLLEAASAIQDAKVKQATIEHQPKKKRTKGMVSFETAKKSIEKFGRPASEIAMLHVQQTGGASCNDVFNAFPGISKTSVYTTLGRAFREGKLTRDEKGIYRPTNPQPAKDLFDE